LRSEVDYGGQELL